MYLLSIPVVGVLGIAASNYPIYITQITTFGSQFEVQVISGGTVLVTVQLTITNSILVQCGSMQYVVCTCSINQYRSIVVSSVQCSSGDSFNYTVVSVIVSCSLYLLSCTETGHLSPPPVTVCRLNPSEDPLSWALPCEKGGIEKDLQNYNYNYNYKLQTLK